jgi:hypothetical protein
VTDEPGDRENAILPKATRAEAILDIAALYGSFTPLLGSVVSNVLTGVSGDRRFERVRRVLVDLYDRLEELTQDQEDYVTSEDFEDILTETLQRVWAERSEHKRRSYGDFLLRVIESPGGFFDDQLELLRNLEQLQPDHLRLIQAMLLELGPAKVMGGKTISAIVPCLPDMEENRVRELAQRLDDLHITNFGGPPRS